MQQRISSCLTELDPLLSTETEPVVASMVVAEKRIGSDGKGNLIECVCNIMGIRDIKTVSSTASLSEVGMDSLVSVDTSAYISIRNDRLIWSFFYCRWQLKSNKP